MKNLMLISFTLLLGGCLGFPKTVTPINHFDINRYLGKWYEIARLDHSFERGLENVTAEYVLQDDGGVQVINRGFAVQKNQWKEAKGKAYFVGRTDTGHLKVSFFGPFYSSYVIFELDEENYQHAFVCGMNESYLWLLSRTPEVSDALLSRFSESAKSLGFKTNELIYVKQK